MSIHLLRRGIIARRRAVEALAPVTFEFLGPTETFSGANLTHVWGFGSPDPGDPSEYASQPYSNGGFSDWDVAMPSGVLVDYANRFSGVRLSVDVGPMCAAGDSQADAWIADTMEAVTDLVGAGLKVVYDLHPQPFPTSTGWNFEDVLDGLSGTKWIRYKAIAARIAGEIAEAFEPSEVALELFNEPPPASHFVSGPTWSEYLADLFAACRAAIGPRHALIVAAQDHSGVAEMVALDPADFDAGTMFKCAVYEPPPFTMQGTPNGTAIQYLDDLAWPPDPGQDSTALAEATARINADPNLDSGQKSALIAQADSLLTTYIWTPQGLAWLDSLLGQIPTWLSTHDLPANRVFVAEYGAWGANGDGASIDDRARWFLATSGRFDSTGINHTVWEWHNPYVGWSITDSEQEVLPEIADALDGVPRMEGATAGSAAGTPGTLPTGWVDLEGGTWSVVQATHVDDYVEAVDIAMPAGDVALYLPGGWGGMEASPSDVLELEVYAQAISGSATGLLLIVDGLDAGYGELQREDVFYPLPTSGSFFDTRRVLRMVAGAGVARAHARIAVVGPSGAVVRMSARVRKLN